jgi:hypothetical protein
MNSSIYNTMCDNFKYLQKATYKQYIDLEKIKYLFSLPNEKFLDLFDEKFNKKESLDYLKNIRQFLIDTLDTNNTEEDIDYTLKGNNRLYANGFKVQNLQHDIRNFIVPDDCKDFDMQNAHFSILLKLCKDTQLKCTFLQLYVDDRDNILKDTDYTKHDVIAMMNTDKPKKAKDPIINSLMDEIKKNKPLLISKYKKFLNINKKVNKKNPISSDLSNILNFFENYLLSRVITHYDKFVTIPMYDGFVARDPYNEIEISFLNELTEDFGVKWTVKPMETCFEMTKSDEIKETYKSLFVDFEKNNCFIKDICAFKVRSSNDNKKWSTHSKTQMETIYSDLTFYNEENKQKDFFKTWMVDKKRTTYDHCEFAPYSEISKLDDNIFNLFYGFENERDPDNDTNIDWFHHYIKELVNNEEPIYDYILDYIAHIVQHPEINPKVALVIKGLEGTGKDSLIDFISFLIGDRYLYRVQGMDDFFGDFNGHLANKIVLSMNEVQGKDGVKYEENLKEQITKDTLVVKEKYITPYSTKFSGRFIILSNNESPIQYSSTDRGRFLIIKTNDSLKNNKEFWNSFHSNIRDKDVMKKAFSYFLTRDISNFNNRSVPITYVMKFAASKKIKPCLLYIYETIKNIEGQHFILRSSINKATNNIALNLLEWKKIPKKKDTKEVLDNFKNYMTLMKENGIYGYRIHDCQVLRTRFDTFEFSKYDRECLNWTTLTDDMFETLDEDCD